MATLAAIFVIAFAFVMSISDMAAAKGPVVYVFGDSMSDVGNNNYLLLSIAKSDYPWYGIDYYTGWPTGRFSNGRTIGDIMCKLINIQMFTVIFRIFFPNSSLESD